MVKLPEFNMITKDGVLQPEGMNFKELYDQVMQNQVVIMKNVFPAEQLLGLRTKVHQWGLDNAAKPKQTYLDDNYHAIEEGISPRQGTKHNYHSYNFNRIKNVSDDLRDDLLAVVDPIRVFQNSLTGNDGQYEEDAEGRQVHPQIIHYPSGGGMLDQHVHGFEPQRVGLILGLSKRGTDFGRGATYFEIDGERVSTDAVHDVADLILFKFDIPHGISEIDVEDELDYSSDRGRWTLVLPYYSLKKLFTGKEAK